MFTKTRSLLAFMLMAALFSAGCFKSKTEVTRVPNDTDITIKDLKGVYYSLPRTVVKADVPFKLKEEKPGVLEKFTPCFYPADIADERVREDSKSFSIEDPTIAFRVEPDPEEHFIVSVKGGYFENKSLLLDYAPGGIPKKGEASSENQALDFLIQAGKTATSIITGFAGLRGGAALRVEDLNTLPEKEKLLVSAYPCFWTIVQEKLRLLSDAEEGLKKAKTAKEKKDAERELCKAQKALEKAKREAAAASGHILSAKAKSITVITDAGTKAPARFKDLDIESDTLSMRNEAGQKTFTPSKECPDDIKIKSGEELLSDYERAEKTFNEIRNLEQSRLAVVGADSNGGATNSPAGALPPDTMKTMLQELDAGLKSRNALFFGSETVTTWTAKFEYVPTKLPQQAKELLWFDEANGLCDTRLSKELGITIPKKFRYGDKCTPIPPDPAKTQAPPEEMEVVFLQLRKDMSEQGFRDQMARVQTNLDTEKKKRGWYYRIPAPAFVQVRVGSLDDGDYRSAEHAANSLEQELLGMDDAKNLKTDTLTIAQLGVTVSVPSSGGGRTNQSTIEYDDAGALKNFKYSSNALLQKSQLEEIQAGAQTVIDAKKASNEKKEKASDQLEKMKRELEILETQNKINEEKKKLEQSNGNGNSNTTP